MIFSKKSRFYPLKGRQSTRRAVGCHQRECPPHCCVSESQWLPVNVSYQAVKNKQGGQLSFRGGDRGTNKACFVAITRNRVDSGPAHKPSERNAQQRTSSRAPAIQPILRPIPVSSLTAGLRPAQSKIPLETGPGPTKMGICERHKFRASERTIPNPKRRKFRAGPLPKPDCQ
jgi:hypothetical protein